MNLFKKGLLIESTIQIFKVRTHESGFASPPARICKDLRFTNIWKLTGFVINDLKQLFKSGFVIHGTIRIQDLYRTVDHEPFWSQDLWNKSMFLRISYMIPARILKNHSFWKIRFNRRFMRTKSLGSCWLSLMLLSQCYSMSMLFKQKITIFFLNC